MITTGKWRLFFLPKSPLHMGQCRENNAQKVVVWMVGFSRGKFIKRM
jgi:hypothetical protein